MWRGRRQREPASDAQGLLRQRTHRRQGCSSATDRPPNGPLPAHQGRRAPRLRRREEARRADNRPTDLRATGRPRVDTTPTQAQANAAGGRVGSTAGDSLMTWARHTRSLTLSAPQCDHPCLPARIGWFGTLAQNRPSDCTMWCRARHPHSGTDVVIALCAPQSATTYGTNTHTVTPVEATRRPESRC